MSRRTFLAWGALTALVGVPTATAQQEKHPAQGKDHMHHRFDPKESAKSFDDPGRDAWQKPQEVIAALSLTAGQTVADIGAGTGYFTIRLAQQDPGLQVFAADLEASMLGHIRERATKAGLKNVKTIQASETSANLPAAMDCILIVNTYHHIGDRVGYFRSLGQSLKPQGKLAIIDFKKGAKMGPPEEFRFTVEKIQGELTQAGYKLVAKHDFLPQQNFLIFGKE